MWTQDYVFSDLVGVCLDKKGVLHVARGMVGCEVQLRKHVQVVVDFWSFGEREAHSLEDVDDLVAHDG